MDEQVKAIWPHASWYSIRAAAAGAAELLIFDEIGEGGVTAKQFITDLQALGEIPALTVRINSPGGDVFGGAAIYNALAQHPAQKTVWIDGVAASIASIIAMAGDEILMPENAFLFVHEPWALVLGRAPDMRSMAEALDRIAASMVGIYAKKSRQSAKKISELMAAETWMSAQEAKDLGFADKVVDPVRAAARFDAAKFRAKHVPPGVATNKDLWDPIVDRLNARQNQVTAGARRA